MNKAEKNSLSRNTFLLLLAAVTFAFLGLIWDFLLVGFWSVALAIIFMGIYEYIRERVKGRTNVAAGLTTLFILLVVVLPLALITLAIVGQSQQLYGQIQTGDFKAYQLTDILLEYIPYLQELLQQFDINLEDFRNRINSSAAELARNVGSHAIDYTQNLLNVVVQFFLMLYLLFFFLRDGQQIVKAIGDAFPLGADVEYTLFKRFASVTRATLKGTMIVAMIQGLIGGILFWAVGIDGAILWGVLMTLLALLPVGGSAIIWVPAAIILFVDGQTINAAIVFLVGSLIIGLIDNLLRPQLVGRETEMPDYLILLATLGGIAWVGLAGFIIGPVIAALFITCWELMAKETLGENGQ